jgi:MoxR-like ATPase
MEEKTVTIDGISHPLSDLFLVVATQNPIEYEGTYRLPEAQLDRFLLKLQVHFPPADEEDRILRLYEGRSGLGHPLDLLDPGALGRISNRSGPTTDNPPGRQSGNVTANELTPLSSLVRPEPSPGVHRDEILRARAQISAVVARTDVCSYVGKVVRATRELDRVLMGASSRAAVHLLQAAKARALIHGRDFVTPDDVKEVCRPVLRHRVTLQPDAYVEGFTTDDILTSVLEKVEVPR